MSDVSIPTRVPSGVTPVTQGGSEPLVDVVCPGCGTVARVRADRRSASDFCATCDHPLFWAGTTVAAGARAGNDSLDAHFRAPGVVGTSQHGALACPACGENNHPTWTSCVRCGSDLNPPPPAPVVAPLAPAPTQVITVERPVPCGHPPVWLVALISSLITAAVVAAVFLIF